MHELSLANSVISIVTREMEHHSPRRLKCVELTVGARAGIELDTFGTALRAVIRSSPWPGADAKIITIPALAECVACGARFEPQEYIPVCPQCGSGMCGIVSGTEFRVSALILADG